MFPTKRKINYWPGLTDDFDFGNWMPNFFDFDVFSSDRIPAVNVVECDDKYKIEVAAPGLQKKDFKIEVENDVLTISSEKKDEKEVKKDRFMRREFGYSSFKRSFQIPENTDANKIKASHDNGILNIELPRKKEEKSSVSKEIKIN